MPCIFGDQNTDCLSALMVEKGSLIANNANRLLRLQIAAFRVLRVQMLATKALNKDFYQNTKVDMFKGDQTLS